MTGAGTPATLARAGTSAVITAPAPTRAAAPIVTPPRMTAPDPIAAPSCTSTPSNSQSSGDWTCPAALSAARAEIGVQATRAGPGKAGAGHRRGPGVIGPDGARTAPAPPGKIARRSRASGFHHAVHGYHDPDDTLPLRDTMLIAALALVLAWLLAVMMVVGLCVSAA